MHIVTEDYSRLTFNDLDFTESSPQNCVTFSIQDDSVQENTEFFDVQFSLPDGNEFQFNGDDTATVIILDDDSKFS